VVQGAGLNGNFPPPTPSGQKGPAESVEARRATLEKGTAPIVSERGGPEGGPLKNRVVPGS